MRRLLTPLFIAVAIVSAALATAVDYAKFYKTHSPAVAAIEYFSEKYNDWRQIGSGFALDAYTVVSAAHVFNHDPSADKFRIVLQGKKYAIKKFWLAKTGIDVAIMGLSSKYTGATLKLSTTNPEIGNETFTMGNPSGFSKVLTVGHVNVYWDGVSIQVSDSKIVDYFGVWGFSNPINPGDSGGPILGSKGQVYGVVFGSRIDMLGQTVHPFCFFTPVGMIRDALKEYRAAKL